MSSVPPRSELHSLRRAFPEEPIPFRACVPATGIPRQWEFDLLLSRTAEAALHDDEFVAAWIENARRKSSLSTEMIPLAQCSGWHLEPGSGNFLHDSGRFFTMTGLRVRHRHLLEEIEWEQPIIEQPEVGILGIAAKMIGGVLHLCLQAKEEPGNIGAIQLSPTVQATFSNYTRAHHGSAPPFLQPFLSPPPERIIFSRLQSEDGGRFLFKSNRNMIVLAEEIPDQLPPGYLWLTLRQIATLIRRDNVVNACTRSILASVVFTGLNGGRGRERFLDAARRHPAPLDPPSVEEIGRWVPASEASLLDTVQWIDNRRALNHMLSKPTGLAELKEWQLDAKGFFSHTEGRFFRIVGLRVSAPNREVGRWCQPIIENPTSGIIGLLIRETPSGREILMQTKAEVGNRNTVQVGPTVQFTPGNYHGSRKLKKPFLFDEFIAGEPFALIGESQQPEEGARFFRESHAHRMLRLPEGISLDLPESFRWLPASHLAFLSHLGDQVNSSARSVIACLL